MAYDESELRDEKGKWTTGGALRVWAGKMARRHSGEIVSTTLREGGITVSPRMSGGLVHATTGFVVSRPPAENYGKVVELGVMVHGKPPATMKQINEHVKAECVKWLTKALPNALQRSGAHIGGWAQRDAKGDLVAVHFDVNDVFSSKDREHAIREGKARNQDSIRDLDKGEDISTGGTGRL